jgi:hypothetical protein
MFNLQTRGSVSKRHIRRIIANKTSIDIAGSSIQTVEQSDSDNTCDNFELPRCSNENIKNNRAIINIPNGNQSTQTIVNERSFASEIDEFFNSDSININVINN